MRGTRPPCTNVQLCSPGSLLSLGQPCRNLPRSQEAPRPQGLCETEQRRRLITKRSCSLHPSRQGPAPTPDAIAQQQPGTIPMGGSQPSSTQPRYLLVPWGRQQCPAPAPQKENSLPWATLTQLRSSKWLKGKRGKTVLTSASWLTNILYCTYIFRKWTHLGNKKGKQQEWKMFHKIWKAK